jgi:hypothetical protein
MDLQRATRGERSELAGVLNVPQGGVGYPGAE